MYADAVSFHCLAEYTNCARVLSYSMTAKRAHWSAWPVTSSAAESNDNVYCTAILTVIAYTLYKKTLSKTRMIFMNIYSGEAIMTFLDLISHNLCVVCSS